MLVQDRIKELNSAIIDVYDDKLEITGFYSAERLLDYYTRNLDCRSSFGMYPKEEIDIAYFKANGLFVFLEDGKEVSRYKFIPVKKETMKYRDLNNKKQRTVTFTISQCCYTGNFSYSDIEKNLLFDTEDDLKYYFMNEYGSDLNI